MKFNAWSMKRIRLGTKHITSRKEDYAAKGDPHVIASVGPLPWWFIRECLYEHEGADSPQELQRVINQIFRRIVQDKEMFYVHIINREKVLEG